MTFQPWRDPRLRALTDRQKRLQEIVATRQSPEHVVAEAEVQLRELDARLEQIMPKNVMDNAFKTAKNAFTSIALGRGTGPFNRRLKLVRALGAGYNGIGNWHRMRTYLHLVREKGMSPAQAAHQVNTYMQTYSRVPRTLKALSSTGAISPVISFPYELARIGANMVSKRPGALVGLTAFSIARNMAGLAAGGANPYEYLRELARDDHPAMAIPRMISSQAVPDGTGNYVNISVNFMDLVSGLLTNDYGPFQGAIQRLDDNVNEAAQDTLLRTGLKQLYRSMNTLSNAPLVNAATALLDNRSATTNDRPETTGSLLGDAFKSLAQNLTPATMPVVGAYAKNIEKDLQNPRNVFTQQDKGVANRILRNFAAIDVRGGNLDALPVIGAASRFIALASGVDHELIPDRAPDRFGLTREGRMSVLIQSMATPGTKGISPRVGLYKKLSQALSLMEEGRSEGQRKLGKKLFKEWREDAEQFARVKKGISDKDFVEGSTDRELANMVASIQQFDSWERQFGMLSIEDKIKVWGEVVFNDHYSDKDVRDVTRLVQLHEKTHYLREPSNPGAIEQSLVLLRRAAENPRALPDDLRKLAIMRIEGYLEVMQVSADADQLIQQFTQEEFGAAMRLLNEEGK